MHVQAVEALLIPGAESPGINVRALQDVTPASRALTTWWVKSITLNGRDVTDEPIDFDQGDASLDITMTNRTAIVRGTVAFTRGGRTSPSGGGGVRRRRHAVGTADAGGRHGEVDDSGRFEVRGLPPGDRYLAVAVEGVSRAVLARPEMLAAVRAVGPRRCASTRAASTSWPCAPSRGRRRKHRARRHRRDGICRFGRPSRCLRRFSPR